MNLITRLFRAALSLALLAAVAQTIGIPPVTDAEANARRLHIMQRATGLDERKHTARIKRMIGINPRTTPWCGAAMTWAVKSTGGKPPKGSNHASAWKNFGKPVSKSHPRKGDIVVFRFKSGYHVAVFKKMAANGRIEVCGGNMKDAFRCATYKRSSILRVRR